MRPVVVVLAVSASLFGCANDTQTTEDFLQSQTLRTAITQSQFEYYTGSNPPTITGKYNTSGSVAASNIDGMVGATIRSIYCYYNQNGDRIDSVETNDDGSYRSEGPGLLISGESGKFTVWKDANSNDTATGCTQHTYVLTSGTPDNSGNLVVEGLTVVLESSGCGTVAPGDWMRTEVLFTRDGDCANGL